MDLHADWSWEPFPVVLLDFNAISHDTPENFKAGLTERLNGIAANAGLAGTGILLKEQFQELILALYRKTGRPVVILIDEYDKPIIDHLGKGPAAMETARSNRDILKSFLSTLKGAEVASHTRFVFITGVSKFSRVSIFSDLNNLIDITMNPHFAGFMGYTREELVENFRPHLKRLARHQDLEHPEALKRLQQQYDGYRFSKRPLRVYNPFSVPRALKEMEFDNYWFETGTPAFLIHLLREREYPLPDMENMEVAKSIFSTYDLEHLGVEALLFQTGYLTVRDVVEDMWHLGYPNLEVKCAFLKHLFYSFTKGLPGRDQSRFLKLWHYLKTEDLDAFFETVNAIFASIPYTLRGEPNEAWFHTLFYLMVAASGAHSQNEVLTSRGRIDMVVHFPDKIWIMEFKCHQPAAAGLRQIHEKGYADPCKQQGKRLLLLGIGFDAHKRMVSDWKVETI